MRKQVATGFFLGSLIISLISCTADATEKIVPTTVSAQGTSPYPWGSENFEKDGQLIEVITCDAGKTKFRTYEGPTIEKQFGEIKYKIKSYTGITISVNDKVLYYIFSPNPSSMSPMTFSYRKDSGGKLIELSMDDRNIRLKKEAPNLGHVLNEGKKGDCQVTTLSRKGNSPPEKN